MRFRRDYTPSILQHAGGKKNVSSNQILHNSVFENNQSANPCCGDFWGGGGWQQDLEPPPRCHRVPWLPARRPQLATRPLPCSHRERREPQARQKQHVPRPRPALLQPCSSPTFYVARLGLGTCTTSCCWCRSCSVCVTDTTSFY